jgi:hypothetical protein
VTVVLAVAVDSEGEAAAAMGIAHGGTAARWTTMPLVMEPKSTTTNDYSASSSSPRPCLRGQGRLGKGVQWPRA